MKLTKRLVEPEVAHGPGRQDHQEAVERVDLADAGVRWRLAPVPGKGRPLSATVLGIAMREGRQADRSLPPGDAANVDRTDTAHDPHVRIAQGPPHVLAEVRGDDLGILV